MTERDYTMNRLGPVIERLKQLGVDIPEFPETEGNEFSLCYCCKGEGGVAISDDVKQLCLECMGSGQVVTNAVFNWQKKINQLYQGMIKRG